MQEWKSLNKENVELISPYYMPWRNAEYTYQSLIPFIDSEIYCDPVLEGWVISAGGLTESTLKSSSSCLMQYIAKAEIKRKLRLLNILSNIFKRNKKIDRVLVPLIVTIDLIYQGNYMITPELGECASLIFMSLKDETKSKNIAKVNNLIFYNLL